MFAGWPVMNFTDDEVTSTKGYLICPVAPGPGVYSASNRNEYQKH
jgi:hypothetical protein